jgi:hypothetical protein
MAGATPLVYYDRTVSKVLHKALAPKGPFEYLAQIVKKQYLVDLQLRAYPNKKRCWATLYVGLTKVLDVFEKDGDFWLSGKPHQNWDPSWEEHHDADHWGPLAKPIRKYLLAAIGEVPERFTNEGAVQSMLCTRASEHFSVIDREAVVGYTDTAEQKTTYNQLQQPLHDACVPDPKVKWFKPKKFGGELDLLAVDPAGRLLVIEIKPGGEMSGIAWAPLQATFYAKLFRAWSDEVGEASRDSLRSMLKQRVDLGLTEDPVRELQFPLDIVPVVAIGGSPSPTAVKRLWKVRDSLRDNGVGLPNLEVWHVEDSVAKTELSPSV